MKKHEMALKHILYEYNNTISKIVWRKFLQIKGDDETQKILEANTFMENLLNGKPIKWTNEDPNWEIAINIANTINFLQQDQEK